MKDVMIDIETWGTRTTSAILQIGACYFDRHTGEIGKSMCVNVNGFDSRFTTDYETLAWWLQQSQEARESVLTDPEPIENAMSALHHFLIDAKYLWAHATFDIPIIQNAFYVTGFKNPIHYNGMRDIRTLIDLAGYDKDIVRDGIHHNALDDAKFQVKYCVNAINKLKI